METIFIALRALFFGTGFVFLWGWLALNVRVYDRRLGVSLPAWTSAPGIILMAIGGILVLVCVGLFAVRGRGTPAPFDAPRQFVAVGPYKVVRNPMYVGALALLAGFGFVQHSISILFLTFLWFTLVHLFVVFYEEPNLRKRFGAQYQNYCQGVLRWLPKL